MHEVAASRFSNSINGIIIKIAESATAVSIFHIPDVETSVEPL